ncbi:MAG: hypothetical protein WBP81_04530 [Solirubrobacteraceae bacterium]
MFSFDSDEILSALLARHKQYVDHVDEVGETNALCRLPEQASAL